MSHAHGKVLIDDNIVGYFEYNGTSDVACTAIQPTEEIMVNNWREKGNFRDCTCGGPGTAVELFADYGSGLEWKSTACMKCMAITGPRSKYDCEDYW